MLKSGGQSRTIAARILRIGSRERGANPSTRYSGDVDCNPPRLIARRDLPEDARPIRAAFLGGSGQLVGWAPLEPGKHAHDLGRGPRPRPPRSGDAPLVQGYWGRPLPHPERMHRHLVRERRPAAINRFCLTSLDVLSLRGAAAGNSSGLKISVEVDRHKNEPRAGYALGGPTSQLPQLVRSPGGAGCRGMGCRPDRAY